MAAKRKVLVCVSPGFFSEFFLWEWDLSTGKWDLRAKWSERWDCFPSPLLELERGLPYQAPHIRAQQTIRDPNLPYQTPGGGALGISGWGYAAGTLEPSTYTRASSAEFCYPILE